MAFKATLKLGDKEFDCLTSSFTFRRDYDRKGRPSSIVYGGTISVVIEAFKDTFALETMVNNYAKSFNGSITYMQPVGDGVMKTLTFSNAFIVQYSEGVSSDGGSSDTSILISAEDIKIGNAELKNEWPVDE